MMLRILLLSVAWTCWVSAEVELITEPRPGEEFVLVQGGASQPLRENFETAHKIPEKLTPQHEEPKLTKTKVKFEKSQYLDEAPPALKRESGEGIVQIEEDKSDYNIKKKTSKTSHVEVDVPLSKIENFKIDENVDSYAASPKMHVELEPMSVSGKLVDGSEVTTQMPVLTTGAPAGPRSFDVLPVNLGSDAINSGLLAVSADSNFPLEAAGSEQKQHSRIQVKKGANGQEYEYEYVYYYYDDDEDAKTNETAASKPVQEAPAPVHNSHDGPQNVASNQITSGTNNRNKNRYSTVDRSSSTTTTSTTSAPESNEVVPANSRNRYRGRNLPQPTAAADSEPAEERSRNLNTTPSHQESKPASQEAAERPSRQKARPQADNHNEEPPTQTRNRSRANVRRPSLELVDSASFNTHASDVPVSQYKEARSRGNADEDESKSPRPAFPSELPAGPSSFVGVNKEQLSEEQILKSIVSQAGAQPLEPAKVVENEDETTEITTSAAMDKVALELYAILAGENLKNEVDGVQDDADEMTTTDVAEDMTTTEALTTTEEITTTTTTTTEATTTSTTTTVPTTTARGSRFRLRGSPTRARTPVSASAEPAAASTAAPAKPRGRYGGASRPSFGSRGKTNTAAAPAVEEKVAKEDASQSQSAKPSASRPRFGSRARPGVSTTASPSEPAASTESTTRSRLRPTLKLRGRRPLTGVTSPATDAPSSEAASQPAQESSSTTARSLLNRGRLGGNIRPLRPGPRLNLGRPTPAASSTEEPAPVSASAPTSENTASGEQDITTVPTVESTVGSALSRLRGRPRLQVGAARPKSTPAPIQRKPSPLLARRRLPETESTEASSASPASGESAETGVTEAAEQKEVVEPAAVEEPSDEPPPPPAPRGLSSLLAGRRRLATRRPSPAN